MIRLTPGGQPAVLYAALVSNDSTTEPALPELIDVAERSAIAGVATVEIK